MTLRQQIEKHKAATRREMAQFMVTQAGEAQQQLARYSGILREKADYFAAVFGADKAVEIIESLTEGRSAKDIEAAMAYADSIAYGHKASKQLSAKLRAALVEEVGEAATARIEKLLSGDNETITRGGDSGRGIDPRKKELDPFWGFALVTPRKKDSTPPAKDPFWGFALDKDGK